MQFRGFGAPPGQRSLGAVPMRYRCRACRFEAPVHVVVDASVGVKGQLAMTRCPSCRARDLAPLRRLAVRNAIVFALFVGVLALVHRLAGPGQGFALFAPIYVVLFVAGEASIVGLTLLRARREERDVVFDDITLEDARDPE